MESSIGNSSARQGFSYSSPGMQRDYERRRWDSTYDPRLKSGAVKNRGDHTLSYSDWKNGTSSDHLARAGIFTVGGSGVKRTDIMNSLGLLTQRQKDSVYRRDANGNILYNRTSTSGHRMQSMPSDVGPMRPSRVNTRSASMTPQVSKMAYAMNGIVPLSTAGGLLYTAAQGGGPGDFLTNFVAAEVAGQAGWRLGANLGFAAGAGKGAITKGLMGVTAGVMGFAGAAMAAMAIGDMVMSSAVSDNGISKLADSIKTADFKNDFSSSMLQSHELNNRRRTMNKLSKSSLNDRGAMMGNEAMILAGAL